jgi:hypothetical protein
MRAPASEATDHDAAAQQVVMHLLFIIYAARAGEYIPQMTVDK